MSKKIDLTGQRFGRLVVVEEGEPRRYKNSVHARWNCKCDCGGESLVDSQALRKGLTKSCGCLHTERNERVAANWVKEFAKDGTRLDLIKPTLRKSKNNTSGTTGVSWDKTYQKWNAYIMLKRKRKNLGYFHNKQDAINARKEAEDKYFKPILDKYAHESK